MNITNRKFWLVIIMVILASIFTIWDKDMSQWISFMQTIFFGYIVGNITQKAIIDEGSKIKQVASRISLKSKSDDNFV